MEKKTRPVGVAIGLGTLVSLGVYVGLLLLSAVLLVRGKQVKPVDLGTRKCFADIAATVAELLDVQLDTPGQSFAKEII